MKRLCLLCVCIALAAIPASASAFNGDDDGGGHCWVTWDGRIACL